MSLFDRIAEQKIQAAIEAGDFDNLPGMGKPLKLDQDPFADPAWQMAAHMLKEGNFKLPWIEIRQEIEADLEKVRGRMRLAFDQQPTAALAGLAENQGAADRQASLIPFHKEIEALNRRIFNYNLEAPSLAFHLPRINFSDELIRLISPSH